MKFTRRPDLDPQTRIHIVMLAWLSQGVYGKMTQIAQAYQISRTFLSQLLLMAHRQLETLFSDEKHLFQKDPRHLDHLLLLLRLEGNCSLLSISSMLKALGHHPHSVGSLSQFFHRAGQALPSTLVMPSKKLVLGVINDIWEELFFCPDAWQRLSHPITSRPVPPLCGGRCHGPKIPCCHQRCQGLPLPSLARGYPRLVGPGPAARCPRAR
jgi:hypothetical protein